MPRKKGTKKHGKSHQSRQVRRRWWQSFERMKRWIRNGSNGDS